ncbi:MAG: ABC transporter ATP-binding protein [Desulfobacteraceae bacterium]|nr:MAG: ABC transporter ATP-binding protein [Desulfobacteraceae bacterium]
MAQSIKPDFIKIFRQIYACLPPGRRRQLWMLLAGMGFLGILETFTAGVVAAFISAVSNPAAVLHFASKLFFREVLGAGFLNDTQGLILFISAGMVGIMAVQVAVRALVGFYVSLYAGHVSAFLGERLLNGFLHGPYEWLLSKNPADLIQSIQLRVQVGHFIRAALKVLSDILVVSIMLAAVFSIAPLLSLPVIIITGLLSYFIFTRTRNYLDRISRQVKDYLLLINRQVYKAINGIKDIRVGGRENLFVNHYRGPAYREARLTGFQDVLSQMPRWLLEFVSILLIAVVVSFMFLIMSATSIKTTGMIALLAAVGWRVLPAVTRIIQGFSTLRVYLPYVQLILNYLVEIEPHMTQEVDDEKGGHEKFNFQNQIVFDRVSFGYAGHEKQVLNDLSFTISKGKTVGIIGVSGAGKSTLVDLMIGLLAPLSGEIMVDDHPFKGNLAKAWMRNIGYVPQSPYICDGTVAENIAYGFVGAEIDRHRVEQCCVMAAMDDFVWGLADGIDTWIGERGVKLSGGQQQRVAIARALYHQPEIMIFDEATSSLDTRSEKAIQETIYSLKGKQTMIIIAHRLSTVEDCDQVVWLENGGIKKIGNPQEILPEYRQDMKQEKIAVAG